MLAHTGTQAADRLAKINGCQLSSVLENQRYGLTGVIDSKTHVHVMPL